MNLVPLNNYPLGATYNPGPPFNQFPDNDRPVLLMYQRSVEIGKYYDGSFYILRQLSTQQWVFAPIDYISAWMEAPNHFLVMAGLERHIEGSYQKPQK